MLRELTQLFDLSATEVEHFATAIIEDNALGKSTAATRRLTLQRLRELYGLDPALPIYRVLRRLWSSDSAGRPLLALLCALARDPLLRASAAVVIRTPLGSELLRHELIAALRDAVGERLNDAVLDKVARNVASTWSQSGHLDGRVRKIRHRVDPTPSVVAFALWLGTGESKRDRELLRTLWMAVLDRSEAGLIELALDSKRLGLIEITSGAGVLSIDASQLDRPERRV